MGRRPPALTHLVMWNANGVLSRRDELLAFVTTHEFSVALLSETHLRNPNRFAMANHHVYRTDRPIAANQRSAGGTAILVNHNVRHEEIALPPLERLEATGVLVHTARGPLRLFAVYSAPNAKLVLGDLDALLDSPLPTIIAGDLNCKDPAWNSRRGNAKGLRLRAHAIRSGFDVYGPTEPTHIHHNTTADVLDIVLMKNCQHSLELETLAELSSDHNPVRITIGDELLPAPQAPRRCWRRADWDAYRVAVSETVATSPITTPAELDKAVSQLTDTIVAAVERSVPLLPPSHCSIYDLPPSLMAAIREKNKARRQWQQLRTPDRKARYNKLERELTRDIAVFRGKRWEQTVGELKPEDASIWTMTRKLLNRAEPSPPLQGRNHLACSPRDKAEVLADSLEAQFTPNPPNAHSAGVEQTVTRHLAANRPRDQSPPPVTRSQVTDIVVGLPSKKAPGADGVTNTMIRELPEEGALRLVAIINASLQLQHFPTPWKCAKVIVFPKPGKPLRDPANYRPISLLSCLSKVLEKVVLSRLKDFVDRHDLLIPQQFGFRPKHSTTHQLLRVTNHIREGLKNQKSTGVIFLDIAKAFDRVWHTGLVGKLISQGFDGYLINWVVSYLDSRSFFVALRGEQSTTRPIAAGVPQGGLISPLLFNLLTNDIPTDLPDTQLALYADDAAIYCQTHTGGAMRRRLQASVDKVCAYYHRERILVNATKTEATFFTRRTKVVRPLIRVAGEAVQWRPHSRYLGVVLDKRLTFAEHLRQTSTKAYRKLAALRPLFRARSMLAATKVRLYEAIIRPTMTYASPIWANAARSHQMRLQRIQNAALKAALRLPRYARTADVHRQCRMATLGETTARLNNTFAASIPESANPLISALH